MWVFYGCYRKQREGTFPRKESKGKVFFLFGWISFTFGYVFFTFGWSLLLTEDWLGLFCL